MKVRRRSLLQGLLCAPFLSGQALASTQALALPTTSKQPRLKGRIVACGGEGRRHPAYGLGLETVLTEVDVATGVVRQTLLRMPKPHAVFALGKHGYVCISEKGHDLAFIDPDLRESSRMTAPSGYRYAGHGIYVAAKDHFILSLQKEQAAKATDHGQLQVIGLEVNREIGRADSGALMPHDLCIVQLDGKDVLAVSHYGYSDVNDIFEPALVLFHQDHLGLIKRIDTPAVGALSHMAKAKDGRLCAMPFGLMKNHDAASRRYVEHMLGDKKVALTRTEESDGQYALPVPAFIINVAAGSIGAITGLPVKQRRPQSIAYDAMTDHFFVTFTVSDTIAKLGAAGEPVAYADAFALGLSTLRGIASLGVWDGIPVLAVSGEQLGLALLDARDLSVLQRWPVPFFGAPHLTWVA